VPPFYHQPINSRCISGFLKELYFWVSEGTGPSNEVFQDMIPRASTLRYLLSIVRVATKGCHADWQPTF
jgi:hypothetical protein